MWLRMRKDGLMREWRHGDMSREKGRWRLERGFRIRKDRLITEWRHGDMSREKGR